MAKSENLRRPDKRFDPACGHCNKNLAPVIWVEQTRKNDMHLTCDVCFDAVCTECCEEDDNGNTTCLGCVAQRLHDERPSMSPEGIEP